MLSQEGEVLPELPPPPQQQVQQQQQQQQRGGGKAGRGGKAKQGKGPQQVKLPLEMAERLLQAYPKYQQQQQQGAAAGAAAAAAGASSSVVPADQQPLLPKEVFIEALVGRCCGSIQERKEKVVIFSQVGAAASACAVELGVSGHQWVPPSAVLTRCRMPPTPTPQPPPEPVCADVAGSPA
jgi:hypothetical protein